MDLLPTGAANFPRAGFLLMMCDFKILPALVAIMLKRMIRLIG